MVKKSKEEQTKRKIAKNTQPAVKIDGGINAELTDWLKTKIAQDLGYHSKSQFITEAVREFMQRVRGPRFTDLQENENGDYSLIDTYILNSDDIKIQVDKMHKILHCEYCKQSNCDHTLYVWRSRASSTRLFSLGFRCNNKNTSFQYRV